MANVRLPPTLDSTPTDGYETRYDSASGMWVPTQSFLDYDFDYLFSTDGPPHYTSNTTPVANTMYAKRMVMPRSGTISDFIILIGGTSSGNVDVGVYSFDGTNYAAQWRKGSTACPAANTWTSMGNPAYAVTKGQIIFPCIAFDNATATPARLVALGAAGWHSVTGMTYPKFAWSKASSFPLPSGNTADSGVTVGAQVFAFGIKLS